MPTDEERMAFKRQEREAAAAIMAGDRYCPDPSAHEHRAASQERPQPNPHGEAQCAWGAPCDCESRARAQERPQPDEALQLAVAAVFQDHRQKGANACYCGWRPNIGEPSWEYSQHLMLRVLGVLGVRDE